MEYLIRAEGQDARERASIRPVMMQFAYDSTVKLWRVIFRPRGESVPVPRVMHFGDAEKLRDLCRRFGPRQLAEDHAALEFAINGKRGAVELLLGDAQLRELRKPGRRHSTPSAASHGRVFHEIEERGSRFN